MLIKIYEKWSRNLTHANVKVNIKLNTDRGRNCVVIRLIHKYRETAVAIFSL